MEKRKLLKAVLGKGKFLPWDWQDNFLTDRAAGAINGTAAEPGPGNRVAVDPSSLMTLSGGEMVVDGTPGTNETPRLYKSGAVTRAAGIWGSARFRHRGDASGSLGLARVGFHAPTFLQSIVVSSDRNTTWAPNPTPASVGAASYTLRIGNYVWAEWLYRLRGTGAAYYVTFGGRIQLVFVQTVYTDASLNFGMRGQNAILHGFNIDHLKLADTHKWVHKAIASDSFDRADGAPGNTDGLGCEETGGSGLAWESAVGTAAISSNRLGFSALSGGLGISLVNPGIGPVCALANLYRAGGAIGIVFMYKDASNYYYVTHDGTAVKIFRVTGGAAPVERSSYTTAFVDGAPLEVVCTEVGVTVFYNNASVLYQVRHTGGIATAPLDGTKVGIIATDAGNTVDNFAVWETYPTIPYKTTRSPIWIDFGDSLTDVSGSAMRASVLQSHDIVYAHYDYGIGGETTTAMRRRFDSEVLTKSANVLCLQAGINNLLGGGASSYPTAGDTVIADLQYMCTAAHNAGMRVVLVSLFPCKNASAWTTYAQQNIDAVNAAILGGTITNVDVVVDAYTALEDPGAADALLSAYDSGDHLHLSVPAGYGAVGDAIYTACNGVIF